MKRYRLRRRLKSLRVLALLAITSVCMALIGLGSGSAQAAAPSSSVTVQNRPASASPGHVAPLDTVINGCTVQVNNPHISTHVPENVNVTGTITCTEPMVELDGVLELYYNGRDYDADEWYGSGTYHQFIANTPCQNGEYYAVLQYWLEFPSGTPLTANGQVESDLFLITC